MSLLLFGIIYGSTEIIQQVFFTDTSQEDLRWFHFSRGLFVALAMIIWAAWTVYNYRGLYQEKLDVTEARYRDIIEHSADAIIALDNNDTIISWNRGAEDMFGWDREDIVGLSVKKLLPGELIEQQELEVLDEEMNSQGHVVNYETERLNNNGERVLVNLTQSYIRNEKDEVIGRSQILRDLTNIKLREEQIQHSERLASVGHMAAGVAHEVGNPLTAISSLVQVCQRKTDDPFVQDQLSKVRDHIHRITKIVRDLVDFSRPSSIETKMMQVNDIIKSAVGLLRHDARCRDVNFQLDLSESLPKIKGVPDHIHQVIVNLLINSVDAMEHADDPQITIKTRKHNGMIQFSIRDVGKGISEEDQKHIFEPFYTTKEVGSGTGLGLSVSHGIISKMNGTINVNSEEGKGTTFTISLPINQS